VCRGFVFFFLSKCPNAFIPFNWCDYKTACPINNSNDQATAIKYLSKAFELSGDDTYKERMDELKEKN